MPDAPAAPAPAAPNTSNIPPTPQNGAATAQPAAAATAPEAEYELTVDGKAVKYRRSDAEKLLGKAAYADKLIRDSVEKEKKAAADAKKRKEDDEAEEELWKSNPLAAMEAQAKRRGLQLDELARQRLEAKLKEAEMSPEQRERERADRAEKALKEQEDKRIADEQEKVVSTQAAQIQKLMEEELVAAADAAGLGKDEDSFFAIYEVVRDWTEAGLPWDAKRIIEIAESNVSKAFDTRIAKAAAKMPDEKLMKLLGDDVIRRASNYRISQYRKSKTTSATPPPVAGGGSSTRAAAGPQYLSPREADARLRAIREKVKG